MYREADGRDSYIYILNPRSIGAQISKATMADEINDQKRKTKTVDLDILLGICERILTLALTVIFPKFKPFGCLITIETVLRLYCLVLYRLDPTSPAFNYK